MESLVNYSGSSSEEDVTEVFSGLKRKHDDHSEPRESLPNKVCNGKTEHEIFKRKLPIPCESEHYQDDSLLHKPQVKERYSYYCCNKNK